MNITKLIINAISAAQEHHHLFTWPSDKSSSSTVVVVGVSGGADSVCLLDALTRIAPTWRLVLHVAHLNHNLRPEAFEEAAYVKQLAHEQHLPFHAQTVAKGALYAQSGGLEQAARQTRYTFLCQVAQDVTPKSQCPVVAVAHHADDQAETVLMNLVRGSGLNGLGGMRWVQPIAPADYHSDLIQTTDTSPFDTVRLVRPLLDVDREQILAYLQENNLRWYEDSSNQDRTILRNYLRHEVVPRLRQINPSLTNTLKHTAQVLSAEFDRTAVLDKAQFNSLLIEPLYPISQHELGATVERIVLELERLMACHLASQRGVLRLALGYLGVDVREIRFEMLERLLQSLNSQPYNRGPHPLIGQVGWSLIVACGENATQLSLHKLDSLPVCLKYPHLDQDWQNHMEEKKIPHTGTLLFGKEWQLQSECHEIADLPSNWKRNLQPWEAILDADALGELVLTTPQPNLRFAPLGLNGGHKTLGDLFTDSKIHSTLRSGWPLVIDGKSGRVLWVCGLRASHHARVRAKTKQVIWLKWKRTEDYAKSRCPKSRP